MPSQFYNAGVAADAAAKHYQAEHPGTNYETALRTVCREANARHKQQLSGAVSRYEKQYGSGVPNTGWKVYEDASGNVIDLQLGDGQSISRLSNIVTGLPRLSNGSVDSELALKIINGEFAELARQACGAYLGHQAQVIRGNSKPHEGVTPEIAMREAQRQNPGIAAVYSGNSRMSEDVMRAVLWPLFKVSQPEAPAPGERSSYEQTSVKRYSADHIYHDNLGREYRRY